MQASGCWHVRKSLPWYEIFGSITILLTELVGRDVRTDEEVAIKLEHYSVIPSLLFQEADIYDSLKGRPGVPLVFWRGNHGDFQIMVFELLGPNLEDLLRYCGGRFSLKTTLMLMDQSLRRVECLHTSGHLHRDIKPENFLLGTSKRGNVVYMTDLGLATYRPPGDDQPGQCNRAPATRPSLIGTCRYASIHAHLGVGEYGVLLLVRTLADM